MSDYKKPPLGLIPKMFWDMKRLDELRSAIYRYAKENCFVPIEWVEEYNEIAEKYKTDLKRVGEDAQRI
jgi:hypothetical protein